MIKESLLYYIHLIIFTLAILSPVLFSYKIVFLGVVLNYVQLFLFKGCILSRAQYKDSDSWFVYDLILKLGFRPDKKHFGFFGKFILPPLILIIAIMLQIGFDFTPILSRLLL